MSDKPLNILFLMTDQQRVDHVGFHPQARMATPNIDRIAQGVGFTCAVSPNPICMPCRTSLITGKWSHQIGSLSMSGDISVQHPTYFRALQQAGYWTAAVGKLHWFQGWPWGSPIGEGHPASRQQHIAKAFGLDHVWEVSGKQLASRNTCEYCEHLRGKGILDAYRTHVEGRGRNFFEAEKEAFPADAWPFDEEDYVDIVTGDRIVAALDERPRDKPFMLFGSFCSPHAPFDPPASYLEQFADDEDTALVPGDEPLSDAARAGQFKRRKAYKAMIKLVDDQVGRILDKLEAEGELENTLVLFTSDHGEMAGDHGWVQKASPYWQSAVVPTAVRHPHHLRGVLNASPISLIDLTATMLDAARIDPQTALSRDWPAFNDRVPCKSLMPILDGSAPAVRDYVFSESVGPIGHWQLIATPTERYVYFCNRDDPDTLVERYFDLRDDPNELNNRVGDQGLRERVDWCRRRRAFELDVTPPAQLRFVPTLESTWHDVPHLVKEQPDD